MRCSSRSRSRPRAGRSCREPARSVGARRHRRARGDGAGKLRWPTWRAAARRTAAAPPYQRKSSVMRPKCSSSGGGVWKGVPERLEVDGHMDRGAEAAGGGLEGRPRMGAVERSPLAPEGAGGRVLECSGGSKTFALQRSTRARRSTRDSSGSAVGFFSRARPAAAAHDRRAESPGRRSSDPPGRVAMLRHGRAPLTAARVLGL